MAKIGSIFNLAWSYFQLSKFFLSRGSISVWEFRALSRDVGGCCEVPKAIKT